MTRALLVMASLWATGAVADRRGNTAIVVSSNDFEGLDPATNYDTFSWQMEYATCAKLLNYRDAGGPVELVPEIARALPQISADGTVYTFAIRGGFRFSPPSNEWVTAATLKDTIDRALDPVLQGPAGSFLGDVTSIDALDGDGGGQLRFTLQAPAGDFLHRLSMAFFCVLPMGTPHTPITGPYPSAGPFYIFSYQPVQFDADGNVTQQGSMVLRRNPHYGGSRPVQLDEIRYVLGGDASPGAILNGAADYTADGLAPDDAAALAPLYGPGSPAAAAGHQQLFNDPAMGYQYIGLNVGVPNGRSWPLADENVRLAVNYAIDRPTLGGITGLTPNDNYLPPGIAGYQDQHIYPLNGPDLATASALLAGKSWPIPLALYTSTSPIGVARAAELAAELSFKAPGCTGSACPQAFDVSVKYIPGSDYFATLYTPGEPWDIAVAGWVADYPDPFDFLNLLFRTGNLGLGNFSNPVIDAELDAAVTLTGSARASSYAAIDVELMALAPLAVIGNFVNIDFFSSRMGCETYNGVFGMDLATLCIRHGDASPPIAPP